MEFTLDLTVSDQPMLSLMNAAEAFAVFVKRVLVPGKARRSVALAFSKKGQQKILKGLCHEFGPEVRPDAVCDRNYNTRWRTPCYVFQSPLGFGIPFSSVREAYDQLSTGDGWLILLRDGSAGIYRPEARWDDEKLIGDIPLERITGNDERSN